MAYSVQMGKMLIGLWDTNHTYSTGTIEVAYNFSFRRKTKVIVAGVCRPPKFCSQFPTEAILDIEIKEVEYERQKRCQTRSKVGRHFL
jgi:hypothetical protein